MQIIKRQPGAPARSPVILPMSIDIEPEEYNLKPLTKLLCTFDTETDPFAEGRIVKPFTCGFYCHELDIYQDFWGDDCVTQFFDWLECEIALGTFGDKELVILAHNGGNFDFYFFTDEFDAGSKPFIINGRLVRVYARGIEFRDSFTIMPFALGEYDKDPIDYRCMERGFRDVFRDKILSYQKRDCIALYELVSRWYEIFGDKLTIASASLPMLRSFHGYETMWEAVDTEMRPYYFGGRNQCFATGVMTGDFYVYDINSSYPDVMERYEHPVSATPHKTKRMTERTHFAHIRAWSLGALPVRKEDGGLAFPIGTYDFFACIHEINAGIATDTLKIKEVYSAIEFDQMSTFGGFVRFMYDKRMHYGDIGDEIGKMHYKYGLNSPYGKFAQDPRKYENWLFDPKDVPTPLYCEPCAKNIKQGIVTNECQSCIAKDTSPWGWRLHTIHEGRPIYTSPQRVRASGFHNVATAASITSAARASLLYGINAATRPLYCDTDSIICEAMTPSPNIVFDEKALGAWKTEARGDTVCIAGKKLYAVFDGDTEIKKASKGVKLTAGQIRRVCNGEVIEYAHPVPKFRLGQDLDNLTPEQAQKLFTTRRIKRTAV